MITRFVRTAGLAFLSVLLSGPISQFQTARLYGQAEQSSRKWGHSQHGAAYDEGPRSRPWTMEGIGKTHFPITSSNPEVQKWFDQGHTLLHGFWFFEAERSFRWCLKLDPECAMAYWGLARCAEMSPKRAKTFMEEALSRKENVSERERAYLEVWEAKGAIAAVAADKAQKTKAIEHYASLFDKLLIDHPDDMEARSLYWLEVPRLLGDGKPEAGMPSRYAMERVLQEVLQADPDHVGALHYRIHTWDNSHAQFALDSCLQLSRIAPKSGHLQHMPGHVLSGVGLWHEAAIAMDAATRVEKDYMQERMILPEQNWNYVHNLDYLIYIQEQLGMYQTAQLNLEQLLAGPAMRSGFAPPVQATTLRLLVKYEKWDEILDPDSQLLSWGDGRPFETFLQLYARSRALLGKGNLEEAGQAIAKLKQAASGLKPPQPPVPSPSTPEADKPDTGSANEDGPPPEVIAAMIKQFSEARIVELEALQKIASEEYLDGIAMLTQAAKAQAKEWKNDPPMEVLLFNTLGECYLELGSHRLAASAFEESLKLVTHDGFALSGLVRAYAAMDEMDLASAALSKLKVVWSHADPDNRWLQAALQTGIDAEPHLDSPMKERKYKREILDRLSPSYWSPTVAPQLTAQDSNGNPKSLEDYAGKNVILIFYQGGSCPHCMEQLQEANKRAEALKDQNTVIVAVSKDDPQSIKDYEIAETVNISVLSDPDFVSARRFKSFDDFEEIELHATFLLDGQGRVHWLDRGGDPFMDFDFLEAEVQRLEKGGE